MSSESTRLEPVEQEEEPSDAESLQTLIDSSPKHATNIDAQQFYIRRQLGCRLRAENRGKVPVLLYWHPNLDRCASVCGVPFLASSDPAAAAVVAGASPPTVSFFEQMRVALFGGGAASLSAATTLTDEQQQQLLGDPAIVKLIVPATQPLEYIFSNARARASLLKLAADYVLRVHHSDFKENWSAREQRVIAECPTWDAHDRQMVLAFYVTRSSVPTAIHLAWPIERIDAQYNGDDCLLRLFISIEFRRALRDRLIAQQRENNRLAAAASIRQQQRAREERDRREHDEQERVEREKVERERVEREMARVVGKEEWQWELKDTSSANEAAGFLQRATNNVVDGTVATAQTIVGGTLATIGGAARATSAGGRMVSNAVGTLVSSTTGLLKQ